MKTHGWLKGLVMITQVGITMIAPIAVCVAFGILINDWLNTVYAVPILLLLGVAASFRNAYLLTKSFYAKGKKKEDAELQYIEALKREGAANKKERENQKNEK